MASYSCRHCWRTAKSFVHPAEVIVGEVEGECCAMVSPAFAECVRQTCESSIFHSHAEVVAFDYRRANAIHIRRTYDRLFLRSGAFSRRVSRFVHDWRAIDFDQLREANSLNSETHSPRLIIVKPL